MCEAFGIDQRDHPGNDGTRRGGTRHRHELPIQDDEVIVPNRRDVWVSSSGGIKWRATSADGWDHLCQIPRDMPLLPGWSAIEIGEATSGCDEDLVLFRGADYLVVSTIFWPLHIPIDTQ